MANSAVNINTISILIGCSHTLEPGKPMRLLLIEDDPHLSQRLRSSLEMAGYAIDITASGVEGEFLGREFDYDVVILDLGLPDRPGVDVLRHWRQGGNTVPVLILTARDSWQERVDGFKAGADDYLGKPFHFEELQVRLQAVIRRSKNLTTGPLSVAGLVLDETTQSVITAAGERIELTNIEFRLLRYFMLHPGKLLSKTQLMEHVYDFDSEKDSNVLEVYMNRLRQKIGRSSIETRRGQGYVLVIAAKL
jgi:DNA-binding response OmpR family regulator